MPFNGNGVFSVYTPGNPVVTGNVISSTAFNNTMTDFASGLTNALTKDGQSAPSAPIKFFAGTVSLPGIVLSSDNTTGFYRIGSNNWGWSAGAKVLDMSATGLGVTGLLDLSAATSGQIKFPATQNASSNANTLDDYEEGTFTPSVGGNASYTARTGIYTFIGNVIHISMNMTVNVLGTGDPNTVTGLPATSANDFTGAVKYLAAGSSLTQMIVSGVASATAMTFTGSTAAASGNGSGTAFANSTFVSTSFIYHR